MKPKTVEQKLYEAFMNNRGLRLTAEEVERLVWDDAVGTRISNMALMEIAGVGIGHDEIRPKGPKTWAGFKKHIADKHQ